MHSAIGAQHIARRIYFKELQVMYSENAREQESGPKKRMRQNSIEKTPLENTSDKGA